MNYCTKCGSEIVSNSSFCNACGAPLNYSSQHPASNTQHAHYNGPVYAILGWLFSGIAILLIPILFGAGAVIFGYLHRRVDQTHGTIIMIAGIACAILGTLLGMAAAPTYYYY